MIDNEPPHYVNQCNFFVLVICKEVCDSRRDPRQDIRFVELITAEDLFLRNSMSSNLLLRAL